MRYSIIFILFCLTALLVWGASRQPAAEAKTGPAAVKLADGFGFTEGPAADADGNVYFTDIPNSRIHRWSVDGELSTFLEDTGGANGLLFDRHGNLIACAGGIGKVISIAPDKTVTVVADTYNGKPFNSPNDLWIDAKGGIYFTDPRYGNRDNLPQDGEHVYYIVPDRSSVIRVIDDMVRPNGLIGEPDGKRLYVADHGAGQTYVYTIQADGTLTDKNLFAAQGSDGMTLDADGNVYLTWDDVSIYDRSGKPVGAIAVAERPTNVCFGGKDGTTLFITARTGLYQWAAPAGIYGFTVTSIDGEPVNLSQYKGKVLLIVNVASQCGFTGQYAGLQGLYERYKDEGLVVLGFPANNFLNQEPGTNAAIKTFCMTNYSVTFPMFSKISVKGDNMHPLYAYLTSAAKNGEYGGPITWNFNKFLIGRNGQTLARFGSRTEPLDAAVVTSIETALAE